MEILNYTGTEVGLTTRTGSPLRVLPPVGNAKLEIIQTDINKTIDGVPIYKVKYDRIKGLPAPDLNNEKYYIVTKEVANYYTKPRFDLLVVEEPYKFGGAVFYRRLINVSTVSAIAS